jgi:hypothetical protein
MKRQLKPEEHEEIVRAIAVGDRVKAKSIYLSATEGNLTEAQNFIKSLTVESDAAKERAKMIPATRQGAGFMRRQRFPSSMRTGMYRNY